ncbi:CYTH domain-containing protein [Ectobacillus ponti]|uniref:CYTH domain-containing protein n=1 Tax=Ectobacillus ponti TaxID=2961894 RepID=A0AA42BNS8_9BACI|nr:CYTH domain-containing protein [Ectobacillus ponti]MCP8968320.1 CYTH domain-containing protein [Ectobacillus ponti]
MKQNIEIEFKNMLTKEEFGKLCDAFAAANFVSQTNHYFETPDFALKERGSALRIRERNHTYTITLKQPAAVGLLETHQRISREELQQLLGGSPFPDGDVAHMLLSLGVDKSNLRYFGSLTTERAELPHEGGILVFDHSFYFGQDDYELEYEAADEAAGRQAFLSLLGQHGIPVRATQNKVQRFFLAKQKKGI